MRRAARLAALACLVAGTASAAPSCDKPVYLTFDTGHMGVAPLVAEVLARQDVKATFFIANEPTLDKGSSLDRNWAPWWKARAEAGHMFGSHTYDHVYWQADLGQGRFRVKPAFGPDAGKSQVWTAAQYCASLDRAAQRFHEMTGQGLAPLFRAPGGKTSPALLQAVEKTCGYRHVGWSPAGFLGDELSSKTHPNSQLLEQALRHIKAGDILMAHLGIWSRQDPWAPAVLEPLIAGLKQKGYCFSTLADHPGYTHWLDTHRNHGTP